MKLQIRNMVSKPCKIIVKKELKKLSLKFKSITLGEVEMYKPLKKKDYSRFRIALNKYGLELVMDKKAILIDRIKNIIIDMVHYKEELIRVKNSTYISEKASYDYTYLANVFSQETGTTIEHYIINQKIERAKELLLYNELNLTEISYVLNYSSVAHLSRQFKLVTGITATDFRNSSFQNRIELEKI